MLTKNKEQVKKLKPSEKGLHPFFDEMEPKINEPDWDGVHVCIDCNRGISKLTAESFHGRCVTCFDEKQKTKILNNLSLRSSKIAGCNDLMSFSSEIIIPTSMQRAAIRSTFKVLNPSIADEAIRNVIKGRYVLTIKTFDKFTIAEVVVDFDNYQHHYFGLSVKNPKDMLNTRKGAGLAFREALTSLAMDISIREMKNFMKTENTKDTKKTRMNKLSVSTTSFSRGFVRNLLE